MRIGMKVLGIIEANAFIGEESGLIMPTIYSHARTRADLVALIEKECGVEELVHHVESLLAVLKSNDDCYYHARGHIRLVEETLSKFKGE